MVGLSANYSPLMLDPGKHGWKKEGMLLVPVSMPSNKPMAPE